MEVRMNTATNYAEEHRKEEEYQARIAKIRQIQQSGVFMDRLYPGPGKVIYVDFKSKRKIKEEVYEYVGSSHYYAGNLE
jgi:hypothetical protein